MVCSAVAASDLGTGAIILVAFLLAAPRTRLHRFTASVHCVPMFKTFLAANWSFIIYDNFSFCLFNREFFKSL